MNEEGLYKESFNRLLDEIEPYLEALYQAEEYSVETNDCEALKSKTRWMRQFLIKETINNQVFSFIVALPKGFPYDFPRIYMHHSHNEYRYLPHVGADLSICTFDSMEAQPNPRLPRQLVIATIKRAIKNIRLGLSRENFADYDDEFLAYWELEPDKKIASIVVPTDETTEIVVVDIRELNLVYNKKYKLNRRKDIEKQNALLQINHFRYFIADNCKDAVDWLKSIGIVIPRSYQNAIVKRGLFLPVESMGIPPFANTNTELINSISKKSPDCIPHIIKFLRKDKRKRPSIIMFGVHKNNNWMLGVWRHPQEIDLIRKGKDTFLSKQISGFRVGQHPVSIELRNNVPIDRFSVVRLDRERLFKRGGTGLQTNQNYRIRIVGCGSVGSFLLEDLVKIGFNRFELVDKEILSPENLARHYCSIEYLYKNKADSLKLAISKKYTGLEIFTENTNIQTLIYENADFLNYTDINIFAIADYPTEQMFNKAYKAGIVKVPTLIVWVEAYLKAGQAVLLLPNQKGCFECLFEVVDKISVFKYAHAKEQKSILREAGCQSSYMPYGALDISAYTNFLSRIVDNISKTKYTKNMLFQYIKNEDEITHTINIKSFDELEEFSYCCEEIL